MILVNEKENVSNGQLSGSLQDARQIAVSTSNLTPDPTTGKAALEKETAFTVEQTTTVAAEPAQNVQAPASPAAPAEPVNVAPAEQVAPVDPAQPAQETVVQAVDPMANQVANNAQTVTEEKIDSIDYNKPAEGVLSDPAVDVVGATGLDSFNIPFPGTNQTEVKEEVKEEPKEEATLPKVEMPTMDTVNNQGPLDPNSLMFENTTTTVQDNPVTATATEENKVDENQVLDNPFIAPPVDAQNNTNEVAANNTVEDSKELFNPMSTETVVDNPFATSTVTTTEEKKEEVAESNSVFADNMTVPDEFKIPTLGDDNAKELPSLENSVDDLNTAVANTKVDANDAVQLKEMVNNYRKELNDLMDKFESELTLFMSSPAIQPDTLQENVNNPVNAVNQEEKINDTLPTMSDITNANNNPPVMETATTTTVDQFANTLPNLEIPAMDAMTINEDPIQGNKFITF